MFAYDSSDEEVINENYHVSGPLSIDWVQFSITGRLFSVAVGELPGRKYKDDWRDLEKDLADLELAGIGHVFCLCSHAELLKYRVPCLLQEYVSHGFVLHHYPILDGAVPDIGHLLTILEDLKTVLEHENKAFIHCFGGLGSSCVVIACLAMYCDETLASSDAIYAIRMLRGPRAVQTVKQYNFINDFKELQREYVTLHPIRRLSR